MENIFHCLNLFPCEKHMILSFFDFKKLISNHLETLHMYNLNIVKIFGWLSSKDQKALLQDIDNLDLTSDEKKQIHVVLREEVKQEIDRSTLSEENASAVEMQYSKEKETIIPNLQGDLQKYRGLDSLIYVNPTQLSEEEKNR